MNSSNIHSADTKAEPKGSNFALCIHAWTVAARKEGGEGGIWSGQILS
jgi:hypothetical protein